MRITLDIDIKPGTTNIRECMLVMNVAANTPQEASGDVVVATLEAALKSTIPIFLQRHDAECEIKGKQCPAYRHFSLLNDYLK